VTLNTSLLGQYIMHALEREEPILEIFYGENGVHAFDYNSAESGPIWVKSGPL